MKKAYLLLADGTLFEGTAVGYEGQSNIFIPVEVMVVIDRSKIISYRTSVNPIYQINICQMLFSTDKSGILTIQTNCASTQNI